MSENSTHVVELEIWADGALNIDGTAAFLGCDRATVYRFMDAGLLVWAYLGRRRKVAKRSAKALLARGLSHAAA